MAKNQYLSEYLNVKPASITQMVQKLAERGLVEYTPYKGSGLTEEGKNLAQNIVRKHRLLECFLIDYLHIPIEQVHTEACRMEHCFSDTVIEALNVFMRNPTYSPTGMEIPKLNQEVQESFDDPPLKMNPDEYLTKLSSLRPGEEGIITYIKGKKHAGKRLQDMGLTPETEVKVLNAAPFHGPIEIEVRGTSLAVGRRLAAHVFVKTPYRHNHRRKANNIHHRRGGKNDR